MLWACLRLPHLAMDAVLRDRADRERPLVLVTGSAQRRRLVAVNAAAIAAGLRRGQSLAAAQALLADFTVIEHDPGASLRWQRLLAGIVYRYSSQVSLDFPNALVLEVGGSLKLFGPWPRLAARLHDDLDALGFRHRLVLAPHPAAAWVLSGQHAELAVQTPHTLRHALDRVPVDRSGLAAPVAQALHSMGLRTLGRVFELPRSSVVRRFGADVLLHLDRLRGMAVQPLNWHAPPDRFDERIEFNYEVESNQALWFPLRRLLFELATFLTGRDGGVQRFRVLLEHENIAPTVVAIGLLAAERDPRLLFEIAQSRLAQTSVPAPVRALRLLATELPAFVPAEADLFAADAAQGMAWPQLRERLRARLGPDQVFTLAVQADHRPEHAWQRQLGDAKAMTVRDACDPHAEATGHGNELARVSIPLAEIEGLRPGWLLARPVPLRSRSLHILAGPERIESGWWDGADVRRDYYVVETAEGQRAWAWRPSGEEGPFMLHGWFG